MRLLLVCSFLLSSVAQASSFRASGFVSTYANELSTRANASMLIGADAMSIGPYLIFEAPHSYQRDQSAGVAMKFGKDRFFEFGGGLFQRNFESSTGKGIAGFVLLGQRFGGSFHVAANLSVKKITEGLEPRTIFDLYPSLGWTFDL